ncbi:CDYL2 protein, partial [Polyodon spathula]|nr:CDYL2 protein [Polyodon spathula]
MPMRKPHNGIQNGDTSLDKDSLHYRDTAREQKLANDGEHEMLDDLEVNDSPLMNGIVSYTIKRHLETGGNSDRNRSGRPKATTESEDKFLRVNSLHDRRLTGQQLQAQLNNGRSKQVSVSTVKRRLRAAVPMCSVHNQSKVNSIYFNTDFKCMLVTWSTLSNGGINLHSAVKRKLVEDKDYVFDKRLRYNVRQNESNCRFRDIVVRKEEGFTHILLSSQTSDNNALTPEIMKEVRRALGNASVDDSKLLLLSSVGSVFCSGLDYSYLIGRLSSDRRKESTRIAESIRDFVKAFIQFKKPIVVAINGPALGLGASILPLCDIVWASEKAWFQTPCATIRLTPAGCSSYTFPQILGVALANEMLFCGRKLTAQEACSRGLVSQVFWPTTFSQEVMLRVKEMATCSAVVLEESKYLVRSLLKSALEGVNEKECQMLKQLWSSSKGLDSLFSYLQDKIYKV